MPLVFPLRWPMRALRPADIKLELKNQTRSGGQSISGIEQVVASPAARWSIALTNVQVQTEDQALLWRIFEGRLQGRYGTIRVPIYDAGRAPTRIFASRLVPFGDRTTYSDGSSFRSLGCLATLAASAALNATTIVVSWVGLPIEPGQHFSINGDRLHRVLSVDGQSQSGLTFTASLTIRPWLRDPWPAGTRLELDDPTCLCRLAADDGMTTTLELWRRAQPTVEFVEAF